MNRTTRDSWKVDKGYSVLPTKVVEGRERSIDGYVATALGIVAVSAAVYTNGSCYLSLRFVHNGRCHSLYTEKFGVLSARSLAIRAGRFVAEVCGR